MYEELKEKLEGCVYTVFTPFDKNLNIDFISLEKYLKALYKNGAKKFYVMAYNSRYSQLKSEEIKDLNKFVIQFVKKLDKSNIVIVGDPIHCSTSESIEFTKHAEFYGADLISLIIREKYFNDEQILDHFNEISNSSKLPILVHEMPFLSGYNGKQINWPHSLFSKLKSIERIAALKEDAKDFDTTVKALELEPQIRIIIAGTKKNLLKYKKFGAMSYLNGISIINSRIGELFWQSWKNDNEEMIKFIINKIEDPFFENIVAKFGWHRSNKALLEVAGFMSRIDRMPLKHINQLELQEVEKIYSEINQNLMKIL